MELKPPIKPISLIAPEDWKYLEEQHKKMLSNQIKAKTAQTELDEQEIVELNSVIEEGDEEAYLKGECLKNECLQNERNRLQSRIDTIYQTRVGGSKEFVELFVEMCERLDIRCKLLQVRLSFSARPCQRKLISLTK